MASLKRPADIALSSDLEIGGRRSKQFDFFN